jgi:hypothetical protein
MMGDTPTAEQRDMLVEVWHKCRADLGVADFEEAMLDLVPEIVRIAEKHNVPPLLVGQIHYHKADANGDTGAGLLILAATAEILMGEDLRKQWDAANEQARNN